jgi:hypothetical protein
MSGTPRLAIAAAVLVAMTAAWVEAAAPAPATGVNITLPYPAKAPLVLHVNGIEQAKGRLVKMLAALPPAEAKQIKKGLDDGLKELLTGRSLEAVPKDGRVFVVVHDIARLADDEPAVSVVIPVTGYKEFKESFLTADERKTVGEAGKGVESVKSSATGDERTLYMTELKGYVALTPSKETAEVYAGKYNPAQSGAMGPDLSASFLNADVSLFVNMDVINDLYGQQIQQFKGLIDFALNQAQMGGMLPGVDKKQLEMAKTMVNGLVQGIEDAKGVVIAAEFRPEGLNVRGQVRFAEDTTSADFLKPEAPGTLADIAKMPRGLHAYGGSKFGKKFTALANKFGQEFFAAEDDETGAARIEKLYAEIAAAGPQGELSANSTPDLAMVVRAYRQPEKAAAALAKLYEGLAKGGKFANVVLKEKPKVTHEAVKHRGFTFTEVRLALDFEASVANLPEQVRETMLTQFKRLMRERSTFWLGTDGKVVVQVTAKDWDAAKKLLDDYLDGNSTVGSDPEFQLARKNLPANATFLVLMETSHTVTMLAEQAKAAMAAIPGGGVPISGNVKPVKGEPTYVGVALTLKPQVASFDLFVPGTATNVATKMLASFFRTVE